MGSVASAYVGWAAPVSDEYEEDDLDGLITKACGFTETRPDFDNDRPAWYAWLNRKKNAVKIAYDNYGDLCDGKKSGMLLTVGDTFRVGYSYADLPRLFPRPDEETTKKLHAVQKAMGIDEENSRLMLWVNYG